jgi:putative ABC transport system substrate-binding protein
MRRRDFIAGVIGLPAAWPLATSAQQGAKLPRVASLVSATPTHPFAAAIGRGLQGLGYTDGRNIALEFHYSEGRRERAAEIAADLARRRVDVIVAHLTPAVTAALAATKTIPIVMAPAGGPLQSGFIKSLAHPGGNVTGLSNMDAEIGGKRLQLFKELIPNLSTVGVLASTVASDPFSTPFVEDLRSAAAQSGITLVPVLVSGPDEFEGAFAAMAKAGAQAVIVQGFFDPHRARLIPLQMKYRLGYMSPNRDTTVAGGLVSLSSDYLLLYERATLYIDKILKGANPGELPVEQPTKFQAVINLKTARELGLTISSLLVAQVDEVIE